MLENNYQPDFSLKEGRDPNQEKKEKTQKIAVIFLAIFGVFFITLGVLQFINRIRSPFRYGGEAAIPVSQQEAVEFHTAVLMSMDTDGDGLSDYDEIYIHKTSPYLEDTDSDGRSDYDEIFVYGSDPKCAEGENCSGNDNFSETASTSNTQLNLPSENENILSVNNEDEEFLNSVVSGEINISVLRELMLVNGFSQEQLDLISDEDLQAIYLEAMVSKMEE